MYKIYLVCAQIGEERLYKIGYTRRSIEKRVKELKTGNAADFSIIGFFESKWGTKIESVLHRSLGSKKINGEWFMLTSEDINEFNKRCQQIHDNLEIVSKTSYYLEKGKF
jgi:hypothetical protein